MSHNQLVRREYSAVHINDKLVGEAAFTVVEEVFEVCLEVGEDCVDDLGLHLGCDQLVEVELLYDHVKVMQESILHEGSYVLVKLRRNIEGFV